MLAPLIFLIFATLTAGAVAYGTHPGWAGLSHGLDVIYFARRLQWPMVAAAVVFCLALVAMVVAGRRRAWWLVGLAPVVALLAHRFATGPTAGWTIVEDPAFVDAGDALSVGNDDFVVGVTFGDASFAYPYAALYASPVVVQSDRERRMVLIWNALANKATATLVDRSLKARDLDLVSSPADGLVVYNTRNGQFINGITGLTETGGVPTGFKTTLQTHKMPWRQWLALRPGTKVLLPTGASGPARPLAPTRAAFATGDGAGGPVTVVATTRPVALVEANLSQSPVNLTAGDTKVLLLPAALAGVPRAFDRRVSGDLFPAFNVVVPDERRGTMLIDADSQTLWTLDGRATSGPLKGEQLRPIPVETGLDFRVMKFWQPTLTLVKPEPPPTIHPPGKVEPEGTTPKRKRRVAG